jgi:hypothetical protein
MSGATLQEHAAKLEASHAFDQATGETVQEAEPAEQSVSPPNWTFVPQPTRPPAAARSSPSPARNPQNGARASTPGPTPRPTPTPIVAPREAVAACLTGSLGPGGYMLMKNHCDRKISFEFCYHNNGPFSCSDATTYGADSVNPHAQTEITGPGDGGRLTWLECDYPQTPDIRKLTCSQ